MILPCGKMNFKKKKENRVTGLEERGFVTVGLTYPEDCYGG